MTDSIGVIKMNCTEKQVYKWYIVYTVCTSKDVIVDYTNTNYWYTDKENLKRMTGLINKDVKSFGHLIECIDNDFWTGFCIEESLFRKSPIIVHYDRYRQSYKIAPKKFKCAKVRLVAEPFKGTIKELAENMAADDFIQYCLDKGIGEKYINEL